MSEHTPRPWTVDPVDFKDDDGFRRVIIEDCLGSIVGEATFHEAQDANAALIAAAPTMLEALQGMVELFDHCGLNGLILSSGRKQGWTVQDVNNRIHACNVAKRAIAAATGERITDTFLVDPASQSRADKIAAT